MTKRRGLRALTPASNVLLMRTVTAIAAAALTLFAGGVPAQAASTTRPGGDLAAGRLIRQHQCVKMSRPLAAPIAGYLIRDTARSGRLFYRDSGTLTSGDFSTGGGTWELRYKCRR